MVVVRQKPACMNPFRQVNIFQPGEWDAVQKGGWKANAVVRGNRNLGSSLCQDPTISSLAALLDSRRSCRQVIRQLATPISSMRSYMLQMAYSFFRYWLAVMHPLRRMPFHLVTLRNVAFHAQQLQVL